MRADLSCLALLLGSMVSSTGPASGQMLSRAIPPMERIRLSGDRRGFALEHSGRPFTPWGVNYGNNGRLIEDFWVHHLQTVQSDFDKIRGLGFNVVRVHLQFGKYMDGPSKPNPAAQERLRRLLTLARENGLYLDLTGLACYRKSDVPVWYDRLSESRRWEAQASFWQSVAAQCAASPAVFCYDLMNDPLVPGSNRGRGNWYSGSSLGGYDFLQFISLDPGRRPREDIPPLWTRRMSRAIRSKDRRTLITVGLLPWTPDMGFLSGFIPVRVAPALDFVSVHIYPTGGKVPAALEVLRRFAVGKPVVIEETFPLNCSAADLEDFLRQSKADAAGWMGHYNGLTPDDYEVKRRAGTLTMSDAIWESWMTLARRIEPNFVRPLPTGGAQ